MFLKEKDFEKLLKELDKPAREIPALKALMNKTLFRSEIWVRFTTTQL